ncbi:MAG: helix-turn-helix domain-containing protein [Patescibacteria group bacterium]|jgi:DNA-binding winged helix-turn-helix (wHTH) protein
MKTPDAFPKKMVSDFFLPWITIFNNHECLSVLHIPKRDQLYRLNELKKLYGNTDTQLISLDFKGEIIEDPDDLENFLRKNINKKHKNTALILLDADQLLDEKYSLLSYLDKMYVEKQRLSIVYLFQKNITSAVHIKRLSPYTSLFQNISVFPYYKKETMEHFFKYLQSTFNIKVPKNIADEILVRCGGSPWIMKQALRHYSQTKDEKNLFDHENMMIKLNILYQELSKEEKLVIEKILCRNFHFNEDEKEAINYLVKTGLITKTKQEYAFLIPILKDFIKKTTYSKNQINLNHDGQLLLNNVLVDGLFSRREKRIAKYLIKNKEKIVNRDEVAEAVWKNDMEQYSDWALDQLMRRLRLKLEKLGLDKNMIKTVKNQGFKFQNIYG